MDGFGVAYLWNIFIHIDYSEQLFGKTVNRYFERRIKFNKITNGLQMFLYTLTTVNSYFTTLKLYKKKNVKIEYKIKFYSGADCITKEEQNGNYHNSNWK